MGAEVARGHLAVVGFGPCSAPGRTEARRPGAGGSAPPLSPPSATFATATNAPRGTEGAVGGVCSPGACDGAMGFSPPTPTPTPEPAPPPPPPPPAVTAGTRDRALPPRRDGPDDAGTRGLRLPMAVGGAGGGKRATRGSAAESGAPARVVLAARQPPRVLPAPPPPPPSPPRSRAAPSPIGPPPTATSSGMVWLGREGGGCRATAARMVAAVVPVRGGGGDGGGGAAGVGAPLVPTSCSAPGVLACTAVPSSTPSASIVCSDRPSGAAGAETGWGAGLGGSAQGVFDWGERKGMCSDWRLSSRSTPPCPPLQRSWLGTTVSRPQRHCRWHATVLSSCWTPLYWTR